MPTKKKPKSEGAPRRRVAFLVDQLFEDSEFRVPFDRLREAGYETVIVGREAGTQLKGKKGEEQITTERAISDLSAEELAGLVIPGGYSPDNLRSDEEMVRVTRELFHMGKPVAAVCHGGWMLAEAGIAAGRTVTSWPSIKTDLINAGARWVDREVVEDGNLITSRQPADLAAFTDAILRQLQGDIPPHGKDRGADVREAAEQGLH